MQTSTSVDPGASTQDKLEATTAPPPAATEPGAVPPPASPTTTSELGGTGGTPAPEEQPGGAGDEEAVRVPAEFTVGADGVSPATVSVPAFLTVELVVRSTDGRAHAVTVAGTTVQVPAGGSAARRLEGLKAGRYPIGVDGAASSSALVAGAEPGP